MFLNIFQYDFVLRGLLAGIIIALVAPVIGIFLVLRRYSLIADTLSHVSLAGIAIGFITGINPLFTAIIVTISSSVFIEKLRSSKKLYGESALALFLSGSLALAVVLMSFTHGFNSSLFNFLFGSITTVTTIDVVTILILGTIVVISVRFLFKGILYLTFDQEAAQVSGINVSSINTIFAILTAATIALAIPIVGVLLISALLIIPVISALQFKKNFLPTILIAQAISVTTVILGVIISFYFNIATGGTIVLLNILAYLLISILRS